MGLVIPNTVEVAVITFILTPPLTLKLYGNDKVPSPLDTSAAYTEIIGGGYASRPLLFANWTIQSAIPPSNALYAAQNFIFTGSLTGPGTIYGYYVVRTSDNALQWAERFPAANVPFTPIVGSKIVVLPKFSAESQF